MNENVRRPRDTSKPRTFDVVCAGAPVVLDVAMSLARRGLAVGLATVLADDRHGRTLRARVEGARIDASGVRFVPSGSELVVAEGGVPGAQLAFVREAQEPFAIPESWSARVLLLSGVSPVVAHAAALCKAARAARRVGTLVVLDLQTRWHLWDGRDARALRMVVREADVVWCTAPDLFGLKLDVATLRSALRPTAVLASLDVTGRAWAVGPFGEVVRPTRGPESSRAALVGGTSDGTPFTAALCAELARPGGVESTGGGEIWSRALERGAASARGRSAHP